MGQRHRSFTLSDGTVIFDVLGAEEQDEDDDDDDADADDDDDDDQDDPDGDDQDDDDDDDDDADSKDKGKKPSLKKIQADLAAAQAELATKDRRMRRADRAKSKALNELNALKTGGSKELSDARDEIARLQGELAAKSGTDSKSLVRDEFLTSDKYTWHDRKAALQLLDLSEIDVDNGKVDKESFEDALEQLATTYPFLVKTDTKPKTKGKATDDDEDEEKHERPSGRQPNGRRPNNRKKTDTEALKKKYGVLQNRV